MLERKFKIVDIMQHYFNSWTLNMSREHYSLGYLFGLMEDFKEEFQIGEYQIAQTSLE